MNRRILILGNGGAGKTSFALRLATKWQCPVFHLDTLYWCNGWQHVPQTQWQQELAQILAMPAWIIEGTPMRDLELRLKAADTIIFIDINRWTCLWRVIKKGLLKFCSTSTADPTGCPVRGISWHALRWVWRFPKKTRLQLTQMLQAYADKTIYLTSVTAVNNYLKALG